MAIRDHVEIAKGRLIGRYAEADNLQNLISAFMQPAVSLEEQFNNLHTLRFIDTAGTAVLDMIGDIVGQPRILLDADIFPFFGFEGAAAAEPFGSSQDASVGGLFASLREPTSGNVRLNNDDYRTLIRARIVKNYGGVTREGLISLVKFIFGDIAVSIEEGTLSFSVNILKDLSSIERYLIQESGLLPKPFGISVSYGFGDADAAFAFDSLRTDQTLANTAGFSSSDSPDSGGLFSSLL